MKMYFFISLLTIFIWLFNPSFSFAHCPLCTGGAALGLSLTRAFGVDDSITGVWLAAFLGASSFWFFSFLQRKIKEKRKILILFFKTFIYILFFVVTIWSFYKFNSYFIWRFNFYLINEHAGRIFGVDKLVFGVISGGVIFYLVDILDNLFIKKRGKVLFPYQRLIVSLGSMIILSLFIYILINYFI